MNITLIAGARPNFMKIAPIIRAIHKAQQNGKNIQYRLVHTGQHFDHNMSDRFFEQLEIPKPHVNLESGGGSQAEQTANIMVRFEKELLQYPTDIVLVVGDVTSTMACSIVAKKLNTKVAHVEAGIRSGDITMPEEVNRIVTDAITDYFFTTTTWAGENLLKSGIKQEQIFFVGNTMIDTLLHHQHQFTPPDIWNKAKLHPKNYIVLTLHRPANVDGEKKLQILMQTIIDSAKGLPIVFPVHPRTAKNLQNLGIEATNLHMVDPLGYLEFNYLVQKAKGVITDSGGITEETTVMCIPCITLRNTTERPETVTVGTNELIGDNPEAIPPVMENLLSGNWKIGSIPEKWDGKTANRIVDILLNIDASKN